MIVFLFLITPRVLFIYLFIYLHIYLSVAIYAYNHGMVLPQVAGIERLPQI